MALRRWPIKFTDAVARWQVPGNFGGVAGVSGILPVRVPVRRVLDRQTDHVFFTHNQSGLLGDQFDFGMLGFDGRGVQQRCKQKNRCAETSGRRLCEGSNPMAVSSGGGDGHRGNVAGLRLAQERLD